MIKPSDLSSVKALLAAEATQMCKRKGEKDTEFVKRIVAAYVNADERPITMSIMRSLGMEGREY